MVQIDIKTPEKVIVAKFYQLPSGRESVRHWLLALVACDRRLIGIDIMKVEFSWPCGPPLCKKLKNSDELHEVRIDLPGRRIARVFFYVSDREMVLLHGFIKKSQKTPPKDLNLAKRRLKEHQRHG